MPRSVPGAHPRPMTIGCLGQAAQAGVETIRYQGAARCRCHAQPEPCATIRRTSSIASASSSAHKAWASLQEISTLLDLADGRNCRAVQVRRRRGSNRYAPLADLTRMRQDLDELLDRRSDDRRTHPRRPDRRGQALMGPGNGQIAIEVPVRHVRPSAPLQPDLED